MKANESKAIMEKLNDLMEAAENFGNQSEQLENARGDFASYLKAVKQYNEKMAEVISKCNEYIEAARNLVERDLSGQIKEIVAQIEKSVAECKAHCEQVTTEYKEVIALFEKQKSETEKSVAECKLHCEQVTTEYKEVVALFEKQKAVFDENQANLVKSVEDEISKATEDNKAQLIAVQDAVVGAFEENKNALDSAIDELAHTVSNRAEEVIKSSTYNTIEIKDKLLVLENELIMLKKKQIENDFFIKGGAIALAVVTILEIINLFI